MTITVTQAVEELGRRAKEGSKEARTILREISQNTGTSARIRKLAAKLFVDAGGRP